MNYFTFIKNGTAYDSRDYPDLIVSELPPITTPPKRHEIIYIDGVDGGIVQERGYGTYEKTMLISLRRTIDIDEITSLLSGSGEIEFSNELGKLYRVTILNQIDYTRLGRYRTASVTFLTQPYKYLKDEPTIDTSTLGSLTIKNQGNTTAYPLITLTGANSVTLTMGAEYMEINLPGDDGIVDCEKQNLYVAGGIRNSHFSGSFFSLPPKSTNTIVVSGTAYIISISPRSRFI